MEAKEIMKYVDAGADFYLRVMGSADHMEIVDNGIYEMMRSKGTINDLCSIYNIRVDNLSDEEIGKLIAEIKSLNMHVWWPYSERLLDALHGKDRGFDDFELYGAMLPDDMPQYSPLPDSIDIRRVNSLADFETWCDMVNNLAHGGTVCIHPRNHYHLVKSGEIRCYLGSVDGVTVATSGVLNNGGIGSLEFAATMPEYREKGFAKAVCQIAIVDAFEDGIRVLSARAIENGRMLGRSLGFKYIDPTGVWSTSQSVS